jgi:hypothetical protein
VGAAEGGRGRLSARLHEDAEGVAVGVGVDPQRLFGVLRPVEKQLASKREHPGMDQVEVALGRHGQIQVQLLGYACLRPRRTRQLRDLLEGQSWAAIGRLQVEPVGTGGIIYSGSRCLVSGAILEAEQLSPKLGADACVRSVQDHLAQTWDRRFLHAAETIKLAPRAETLAAM